MIIAALTAVTATAIPVRGGIDRSTTTEDATSDILQRQIEIRNAFRALSRRWRRETEGVSSFTKLWAHPDYRAIIGMGKEVLPLLFEELRRSPDWWFAALSEITGVNPVPRESRGILAEMTRYWLAWAEQNEYMVSESSSISRPQAGPMDGNQS